jgi:death-on-curing protein
MQYFDAEELLFIHHQLIERYSGSHGVRNLERIKSAVEAPKQSAFGADQYPTIFEKAAMYARNIISDHPFVDGNKRSGITTVILFLQNNGQVFAAKPGELEDFAVQIATDHLDLPVIASWLQEHCRES